MVNENVFAILKFFHKKDSYSFVDSPRIQNKIFKL